MMNRPATIRQADIARTVKGVVAAGLSVSRVEVDGGKLVIYTNEGVAPQESPLEAWRRQNAS
ncbi:hypothetical protein [Pleomorphomonas sp. JP5]|uniref:hypothetical protein n=1 Tax=Pleomorphomonas sp. JP5 TaxID=2942998 RepID=UPI002044B132|nr:hypothetical protein [Pleomorphomonas sp. JP5]MCM5558073.1 hypothetical protein [Pleomorphomonas sp. JP5]